MEENKFSPKLEMDIFLDNMLLQRDVFKKDTTINIWKSAYLSLYGICTVIDHQLQQKIWNGTQIEPSLRKLKKNTVKFVKQVRRRGKNRGTWAGRSKKCEKIVDSFRLECYSELKELVQKLDQSDPIRRDIQRKYPDLLE